MSVPTMPCAPQSAWMKNHISFLAKLVNLGLCVRGIIRRSTLSMCAMAHVVFCHCRAAGRKAPHQCAMAMDWAEQIRYLVDKMYPTVEKIVLVMDNLNTHKMASLYKRYALEEARRLLRKLEIHYTPKHGSWLNIAEIELNVMTRQCLSRRIDNIDNLRKELSAWERERNKIQDTSQGALAVFQ